MNLRVLIIDDNHSFVDSLKFSLNKYGFHYDSVLSFKNGLEKIQLNQYLFRKENISHIETFEKKFSEIDLDQKDLNRKEMTFLSKTKKYFSEAINERGYFLIILDQDTESLFKGTDFILQVLQNNPDFLPYDFLLLTNRISEVVPTAAKLRIAAYEKNINSDKINEFIIKKMKATKEKIEYIQNTADDFEAKQAQYLKIYAKSYKKIE